MVDRIKAAVDARTDKDFLSWRVPMRSLRRFRKTIERAKTCVEAGADGIFAEAIKTEEAHRAFAKALNVPILANITEFGQTRIVE